MAGTGGKRSGGRGAAGRSAPGVGAGRSGYGKPASPAAKKAVAGRAAKADAVGSARAKARDAKARARGRDPAAGVARPRPPRRGGAEPRVGATGRDPRGVGGEQVEGRQAVRELLAAGRRRVRETWVVEDVDHAPIITEIERLAKRAGVPVRYVPRGRLDRQARTDAAQGVLALASALPEADLDDLATHPAAFLVLLDGVTDPHNLGAVLRSAEHAGVTGAVIPRHRAAHVTPTVAKAAAGAIEHVPLALVAGLPAALLRLAGHGVWRVGLDGDADTSIWDLDVGHRPVALVLGAEGEGLSRLTRVRCDQVVSIPRGGRVSSLNVAAAGAVALFEVARARSSRQVSGPEAR